LALAFHGYYSTYTGEYSKPFWVLLSLYFWYGTPVSKLVFSVIEIEEVDFSALLTDLNGWGWSDYKLADEIDMSRSAVTKLRNGERKQPAYSEGCKIVKLHKREKRKQ